MSNTEKIIKYAAVAFAGIIILGIVSALVSLISTLFLFFGRDDNYYNTYDIKNNFSNLDISTNSILTIKTGDVFKIETDNSYIDIIEDKKTLKIKEKNHIRFGFNNERHLTITIPNENNFSEVSIENGAGTIDIDTLTADILDLELGAGVSKISELNVKSKADISTGAGKLNISSGTINNLDLEIGAGSCDISSVILLGNNDIEIGVGKLSLQLQDKQENYQFKIEKGIGNINIDNREMSSNTTFGRGDTLIKIENGIGSASVDFMEKENGQN